MVDSEVPSVQHSESTDADTERPSLRRRPPQECSRPDDTSRVGGGRGRERSPIVGGELEKR